MLSFFQNRKISQLAQDAADVRAASVRKINQGFYGRVYLIETEEKPYKLIAKVYRKNGYIEYEHAQLDLLRKHAVVHVPEIA